MSAYRLDYINSSTRLGRALGISPPNFGPVDYTAAIVYLIQKSRMEDIPHSLSEAQRQIPWRSQWPMVLFHTGDYDTEEQRREFWETIRTNEWSRDVYELLKNRVEFHKLEFELPAGMPKDKSVYKPQVSEDKWPGEWILLSST